jgi:magnesium transporter
MASNKVNEVARTLTASAAIFATLTLVSGVYGMNFEHMPELHWRFGHPYALALMRWRPACGASSFTGRGSRRRR